MPKLLQPNPMTDARIPTPPNSRISILGVLLLSALSDQVESPDRKEFAPIQKLGACPCRKSGSTFPGHALEGQLGQARVGENRLEGRGLQQVAAREERPALSLNTSAARKAPPAVYGARSSGRRPGPARRWARAGRLRRAPPRADAR